MGTLIVEPIPPISRRARTARARYEFFRALSGICTVEVKCLVDKCADGFRGDMTNTERELRARLNSKE